MDCPGCNVEMSVLEGDEQSLRKCEECHGLWIDVADLNRVLLHHNMPGLETLGGKVNTDDLAGQCSECQVDLVSVMGGEKQRPLQYSTCESCGGIFLPAESAEAQSYAEALQDIVGFFNRFAPRKKSGALG